MHRIAWAVFAMAGAVVYAATEGPSRAQQATTPYVGVLDEHPAIQYAAQTPQDEVARAAETIRRGAASLAYDEKSGYLKWILSVLNIPEQSQLLVFSKSGIQAAATGPANPRAIYFNDSAVVGYIAGARFIEIASHDPQHGVIFYTIDQTVAPAPLIERRTNCLSCHVSGSTLEVPGMITRSMFTGAHGELLPQLGSFLVDHRTPLRQRWGGYYVTGNYVTPPYGGIGHMGNVTTSVHPTSGPAGTSNEVFIRWLNSTPGTRGYPSHQSDIAALMVFDHQMHAINLLTRINWESRVAASNGVVDVGRGTLRDLVDQVVDYLLFVDEVAPPARLTPRTGFTEQFMRSNQKDRLGRSLRELDLETRLLRYPCSYMVYSAAFDALPDATRDAIYQRMWVILSAADPGARYSHLSREDRRAIIEILRDTKSDLPRPFTTDH